MPTHVSNLTRTSTGVTVNLRVKPRARSAFGIVKGTTSRTKSIAVTGDVATVANRISGWADSWARENG